MGTHVKDAEPGRGTVDDVFAAIEAHGSGVGMVLLWMVPVLGLVVAVARSFG